MRQKIIHHGADDMVMFKYTKAAKLGLRLSIDLKIHMGNWENANILKFFHLYEYDNCIN